MVDSQRQSFELSVSQTRKNDKRKKKETRLFHTGSDFLCHSVTFECKKKGKKNGFLSYPNDNKTLLVRARKIRMTQSFEMFPTIDVALRVAIG